MIRPYACLAAALAASATAAAQDGALDSDPYFSQLSADPYGAAPAQQAQPDRAAPPRASGGRTERAAPAGARALPRPRTGAAPLAPAPAATPTSLPASGPPPIGADRPLSAYLEARAGWDGLRGVRRDDGVVAGVTGGFDRTIARLAGGRLYAGLLGSIDLSTASRANASLTRDETGADPVLTLTESPSSETRDVEVGARLGWRTDRFGFYAMTALSNRKREADTIVTTLTERADPDDADALVQTVDDVQTDGPVGLFADGWRVGAGAEARLYGPAYLHLGYRYTDYDDGGEKHQVLTGLGARF